jgi:putative ABC transport system substrate-binding protein
LVKAFRLGVSEAGYVEGQNVAITFRWAEGQYERLSPLAAELVQQPVAVIAAFGGDPAVRAAEAATATIPIVFTTGGDPVEAGLVASMNRPGGNATGVSFFGGLLGAKIFGLLHSMVPKINAVAVISNPTSPLGKEQSKDVQDAARPVGIEIRTFSASNERELDNILDAIAQNKIGALIVTADPFFIGQRERLAAFAKHYAVPTISAYRELANAGTLMSYGASLTDAYRQVGVYVGRILKGEHPGELPIMQPTKFELVIKSGTQEPDHRQRLCARGERPRGSVSCGKRNELAPPHSITSSAVASRDCGTLSPSTFAVLRLMTSSNLVGSTTGRSAGAAPLRMRSMYEAACACVSTMLIQ